MNNPSTTHFWQAVLGRRWLILAILTIVTIVVLSGTRYLKIDADPQMFFSANNPQLQAYDQLKKEYSKDDVIVIGIENKSKSIYNPDTFALIQYLTKKSWLFPFVQRVDSLANYMHTESSGDLFIVRELFAKKTNFKKQGIETIREIAITEPTIRQRLVTVDGSLTLLVITFNLPNTDSEHIFSIAKNIRGLQDKALKKWPDHKIYITGNLMGGNAFAEVSIHDMQTLIPIMMLMITITLLIYLRSVAGTIITLMVVAFSSGIAMGTMGWLGIALTSSTSVVPIIIMTLAIADSIHLLLSITNAKNADNTSESAITDGLTHTFIPVLLTSVTTIIGFLGLNFTDVPPFQDLGNIVSVGIFAAFVYTIFLIPILLSFIGVKPRTNHAIQTKHWHKIASFVCDQRKPIILFSIAITAMLGIQIFSLQVDDSVVRYFSPSNTFRQDTDKINENIGGFDKIEYSITSRPNRGVTDSEYLQKLSEFVDFATQQPAVIHVSWIGDIFHKVKKNLSPEKYKAQKLPENSTTAAQYLLLYEMSLPFGRDLTNQINIDKSASRVTISLGDVTTKEILDLTYTLDSWLDSNMESKQHPATGLSVMFAHVFFENIKGMIYGLIFSISLITLTLSLTFRSFSLGLISIIPNAIPVVIAFGIWSMFHGIIDLASASVGMITIGIIVDDTVHFLYQFQKSFKEGKTLQSAVYETMSTIAPALVGTTLVIILGFGVLTFSEFKLNSSLGILTIFCALTALIADLVFLPALLTYLPQRLSPKIPHTSET